MLVEVSHLPSVKYQFYQFCSFKIRSVIGERRQLLIIFLSAYLHLTIIFALYVYYLFFFNYFRHVFALYDFKNYYKVKRI